MSTFNDYPIDTIVKEAEARMNEVRAAGGHAFVHQKWTCKHCGSRQTMAEKNDFRRSGRCEKCGQITIISRCNYLIAIEARSS